MFYIPPEDLDFPVAAPEESEYDSADSDFEVNESSELEENHPLPVSSDRPQRVRQPPKSLEDYVTFYAENEESSNNPTTLKEAMESPDRELWVQAMNQELSSQVQNNSWELTDLPPGRKALNSKWVFKTKRDADGNVICHKARLVVKGCAQRKGIDYDEVYSPVVRYSSVRYLLALAAEKDLQIDQMDAVSAFLQGDLTEEIYMNQPEGSHQEPNKVCRLRKSIYGLKQASRVWNKKLHSCLTKIGLAQSNFDSCVYHMVKNGRMVIETVWVDDLLIFHNDLNISKKSLSHN
uniref:Putative gag-pol polyprotein n=1 Tax=Aster yellows phytoplasma TaxID=35779 RepID=Q849B9_ASTYP|nr:putative gag-pol polyprotein [Aster yellows phytoplasma]